MQHASGLTDPFGRECAVPGGPLSFSAAVDLALCRNPQTRAAWAAAHQQAAALGSTESARLPSLTITGGESRYYGTHADITGNVISTPQNTGAATANLAWTLYDFGARDGKITSARRLLDAAAWTANSVAQQTVGTVAQTYYGVVADDAGVVAAKATEETAARSLATARALQAGGMGTLADVLQAETAYGQAVLARVQADAAAKTARGVLAVTLGLHADQWFALEADPVPADVPALSARMADLMAEAARQRPDLAAARARRDSAEANVTVARAAGRPSIALGTLRNFTTTSGVPTENYGQVGLSFTVPIATGFNVHYGVRQAQAALQSEAADLEKITLQVTLDVWSAYHALASANEQLTVTGSLLKIAADNLDVASRRYQAGVGSIADVLTAQNAASAARQLRINGELAWEVSRAQLALALGRLTSAEPLNVAAAMP